MDGNPTDVVTAISSIPSTATVKPINASRLDMANMIYPVGAIYISVNSTSPASLFGGT